MIFKNMRKCQEKLNDEFPIKFIKHFILANDSELEIFLRVEIKIFARLSDVEKGIFDGMVRREKNRKKAPGKRPL